MSERVFASADSDSERKGKLADDGVGPLGGTVGKRSGGHWRRRSLLDFLRRMRFALRTAKLIGDKIMKAILVRQFGGPEVLKLEEMATPKPAAGEGLARIHAAAAKPQGTNR